MPSSDFQLLQNCNDPQRGVSDGLGAGRQDGAVGVHSIAKGRRSAGLSPFMRTFAQFTTSRNLLSAVPGYPNGGFPGAYPGAYPNPGAYPLVPPFQPAPYYDGMYPAAPSLDVQPDRRFFYSPDIDRPSK